MSVKTIGQKLYEKVVAIKAGSADLVVVHAIDPSAPHGYALILGLPLDGGGFAPLARLLTAVEIRGLIPRLGNGVTQQVTDTLALEPELTSMSPDELMHYLDGCTPDPAWGVAQPFGSADTVEA